MKPILFSFFLITSLVYSQNRRVLNQNVHSCGWNKIDDAKEIFEWETDPDDMARKYVQKICAEEGIQPNFIIKRANVSSALSTLDDENNRIIYYSLSFFKSSESEWFKMAVLAHEIGHFINYHNLNKSSRRTSDELVADDFAGFVLGKLSAPLDDVKKLMQIHCDTQGDDYYPPKSARIEAIQIGYEKGKKAQQKIQDESEEEFRRDEALKKFDCSEFYIKTNLAALEFDENPYVHQQGGIDKYGVNDGQLEIARNTRMWQQLYDYSKVNDYEFETQISFQPEGTGSDIEKQQYLVWDSNATNHIIKGYYAAVLRKPIKDGSSIGYEFLEIGYLDGEVQTILGTYNISDTYRFWHGQHLNLLIRKVKGFLYVFADKIYKGMIKLDGYIPGKYFSIINEVDYRYNSRTGGIFANQLDFSNKVEINYFRLRAIGKK